MPSLLQRQECRPALEYRLCPDDVVPEKRVIGKLLLRERAGCLPASQSTNTVSASERAQRLTATPTAADRCWCLLGRKSDDQFFRLVRRLKMERMSVITDLSSAHSPDPVQRNSRQPRWKSAIQTPPDTPEQPAPALSLASLPIVEFSGKASSSPYRPALRRAHNQLPSPANRRLIEQMLSGSPCDSGMRASSRRNWLQSGRKARRIPITGGLSIVFLSRRLGGLVEYAIHFAQFGR